MNPICKLHVSPRCGGWRGNLAGVRFSPDLKPVTLTTTRTGLRSPVRISSDTASVMVALKSPVRRCLGRVCRIPVRLSLNPMSSNRSASSMMRSSRDFMFRGEEGEVMISCSLPGVPISTVEGDDLRMVRSLDTEDVPPMRRLAERTETSSCGRTFRKPCKTV